MVDAPKENQNPNSGNDCGNNGQDNGQNGFPELYIDTNAPSTNVPNVPNTPSPQPGGVQRFFPSTDENANSNQR